MSTFLFGCGPLALKTTDVYADILEYNGMPEEAGYVRNVEYFDLN